MIDYDSVFLQSLYSLGSVSHAGEGLCWDKLVKQ